MKQIAYILAIVTLTAIFTGCSSSQMTISISTTLETNAGRPFYMVVRNVTEPDYLTDVYEDIAKMVFAEPKDKTVLLTKPIPPGTNQEISIEKIPKKEGQEEADANAEEKPVAIYFLFTDPQEKWKTIVPTPLPSSYCIKLEKNQIESDHDGCCKEGFWRIFCFLPW